MITMMIVDDEPICRQGIRICTSWESYGITIVAEAENGVEALERAGRYHPDIVLTDIRMPVMDGLSLAEALRNLYPETMLIIISAYAEFEYARKLMKLGIEDYLLRPYGTDDLLKCVLKAKANLLQRRRRQNDQDWLHSFLGEYNLSIRSRFLIDFLSGCPIPIEEFETRCNFLGIRFPHLPARIILADMDIFDAESAQSSADDRAVKISKAIGRLEQETIAGKRIAGFWAAPKQIGLVIPSVSLIAEAVLQIKTLFEEEFRVSVTVGVSEPCTQVGELSRRYEQVQKLVAGKAYTRRGETLYGGKTALAERIQHPFSCPLEGKMLSAIRTRDFETLFLLWEKFYKSLDIEQYVLEELKNFCRYFISKALVVLSNNGHPITQALQEEEGDYPEVISRIEFFEDLLGGYMVQLLHTIERLTMEEGRYRKGRPLQSALEYIKGHYTDSLSLDQVAAACYVSPAHLSRLFTKETGETFTGWLNRYRIEKAKIMLQKQPDMKIYEVAKAVGFQDYKYFSHVFKSIEKCLPRNYKDFAS